MSETGDLRYFCEGCDGFSDVEDMVDALRTQLKDAGELLKLAEAVMYDHSKAAEFYEKYGDYRAKYGEVE